MTAAVTLASRDRARWMALHPWTLREKRSSVRYGEIVNE
jgi:hypothetical protein